MTEETKSDPAEIIIGGQPHRVEFNWHSYGEVRSKYGENPDFLDPKVLGDVLALGLKLRHQMVTADQIMTASPPMVPSILAVKAAIQKVYWGDQQPPVTADSPPSV